MGSFRYLVHYDFAIQQKFNCGGLLVSFKPAETEFEIKAVVKAGLCFEVLVYHKCDLSRLIAAPNVPRKVGFLKAKLFFSFVMPSRT